MYWGGILKGFQLENLYIHDIIPGAIYQGVFGEIQKGYGIRISVASNYHGYI